MMKLKTRFQSVNRASSYVLFGAYLAALLVSGVAIADEYPYIYRSPAFLGRGDTGISDANDENALLYNPAGIAMGKGVHRKTGVSLGLQANEVLASEAVKSLQGKQSEDSTELLVNSMGEPMNVGINAFIGTVFSRYGIGFYTNSTNTILLAKNPDFGAFETASVAAVSQYGVVSGKAYKIAPNQSLGLSIRFIRKQVVIGDIYGTDSGSVSDSQQTYSASGTGYDIGYRFVGGSKNRINIGATLENIAGTSYESLDATPNEATIVDDPMTFNLAISYHMRLPVTRFKVLFDYRDVFSAVESSLFKKLHLGSEVNLGEIVGVTAGFNQGYPTIGTYIDLKVVRFDLGMYSEEIGDVIGERASRRIYLRGFVGF